MPSTQVHTGAQAGSPVRPVGYLVGMHPAISRREFEITSDETLIGRDGDTCEVLILDEGVSRNHCRILLDGGSYWIEDLNSTNGTYVNGQPIKRAHLADGDLIGLTSQESQHFRFQKDRALLKWSSSRVPKSSSWKIGREQHCAIALGFDPSVSSVHALLAPMADGKLSLRDEGSTNGTWVDGESISERKIGGENLVVIGASEFRFSLEPDGSLLVKRKEAGKSIAVESVALTRTAGPKKLLDAITLTIRPGEFIGILGPSGAGKSTFLKALNGSEPAQEGTVLYNGLPLYPMFDSFRMQIGFVPQDDIVYPELTVRQSIRYAAKLRVPPDMPVQEVSALVETTIELLGLMRVADSPVSVLSGGQRKRVSIGCELVMRPGIFFLDEPTAGLDPSTEDRLMKYFKNLTLGGTTCLMTTHILYSLGLFDRIIILCRGRLVFIGEPAEALSHFGGEEALRSHLQIFDLLEGIGAGDRAALPGGDPVKIAKEYEKKFRESPLYRKHVTDLLSSEANAQLKAIEAKERPKRKQGRRRSFWPPVGPRECMILAARHFTVRRVDRQKLFLCALVPIVLALATILLPPPDVPTYMEKVEDLKRINDALEDVRGSAQLINELFDKTGDTASNVYALENEGIQNFPIPLGTILMMVMAPIFMGTLTACLELSSERPIYRRERLVGQRITDYLISKVPSLLSLSALMTAIYLTICMVRPELRHMDILQAAVTTFMLTVVSGCLGLAISAMDPSRGQNSVMLAILVILPQLVLSGGLGPSFYDGLGDALKRTADLIPSRWGLEMMLTAAFGDTGWKAKEIRETMGFECGREVIHRGALVLFALGTGFLVFAGAILKGGDVKWRPK